MISTAAFAAALAVFAGFMYLLVDLAFLAPFRELIFHKYLELIGCFALVLMLNLTAGIYALQRKLGLKDTGRKLQHVERQLRTGSSISDELTGKLSKTL